MLDENTINEMLNYDDCSEAKNLICKSMNEFIDKLEKQK